MKKVTLQVVVEMKRILREEERWLEEQPEQRGQKKNLKDPNA